MRWQAGGQVVDKVKIHEQSSLDRMKSWQNATMQKTSETQNDYARAIAKIVAAMPLDRAAEVYDFAQFILQHPRPASTPVNIDGDDWLNDSPEQIAKEDAVWQKAYDSKPDKLKAMVEEATDEYETGKTQPLFKPDGEVDLP